MEKLSKNFVATTLAKIGAVALIVLFGSAGNQEKGCEGCEPTTTSSSGSGSGSGGGGGEGNDDCFDYANFDGTTPTVTFKIDVMPILTKSCSKDATCHSLDSGPEGQPYFGPASGTATSMDIDKILMQNRDVSAKKANMKLVDPGVPGKSFWMHKLDHTLGCPDVECIGGCGDPMPKGAPMLSLDDRNIVRRWIAQGAK